MAANELDIRAEMLNTLLTTPHRELAKVWPVHQALIQKDPRFYVRLAAWHHDHGDVRDHKEMFIIALTLSDFPGHRDVGLALLRQLPPYQVLRVVDFISGRKKSRPAKKHERQAAQDRATREARRRRARQVFAPGQPQGATPSGDPAAPLTFTEEFGLFRNVPRAMKTEITRYLREREADAEWFDGCVLSARKALKRLYALLHIAPGERAQQILFDENPPADSRLGALRQLVAAKSPAEQARTIVAARIPYRVAATLVKQMTPTVLIALIEQMSPQELINSLSALKRRGAFDVPEIKALIEDKLQDAETAQRVSALKAEQAVAAAGLSGELRAQLEKVADTQIKARGRISRPTALLVDKSGSMEMAIELGKRIGAMISTVCEKELYVYAFDTMAYEVECRGADLAAWERAFRGISAGGGTSCGVALKYLERKRRPVEQVILVTDEGQNTPPTFTDALRDYSQALQCQPTVVIVRTPGGGNHVERQCQAAGVTVDVFAFNGDYYSLPNLVPLLARPSRMELLMEIMEYPVPERLPA